MILDGPFRDAEFTGDLLVGKAHREEMDDLTLAKSQRHAG